MMTHRAQPRRATMRSRAIPWYPPRSAPAAPSCADDVVAFIDAGEEDVAEVDGPDPIVDFLEADNLLLERVRDEEQARLEPDRPRVGHALGNVMPRVLEGRQVARVRAGGGLVQGRGGPAPEKVVRTLFIVEDAEPREGALLGGHVALGWPRGRRLEGAMHPFVGPVLLGTGGWIR